MGSATSAVFDGENNDVPKGNIESTDAVEDSGTEDTISYAAFKAMLEDQFEKLSKSLSDGFTKFSVSACYLYD